MTVAASTLDSVRALAPTIREHADRIEQERCLPEAVVRRLIDAGVFRMLMPRSLGGDEIDPMCASRVIEEVATQDGAAGWCAMIGACNSLSFAQSPSRRDCDIRDAELMAYG